MRRGEGRWTFVASILCLLLGLSLQSAKAQNLPDLISACGAGSELRLARCQEMGLSVQAAQGAIGLAASGGSDLPGSASTLGWRMKGSPRFALSVRGALVRAPLPARFNVRVGMPQGETSAILPSIHISGTLGLFDGFSLAPTVGGFGSVDLTASTQWIRTPGGKGFQEDVTAWGAGARVGIVRESFSLPGVSVSAFYRALGQGQLWNIDEGDPAEGAFDLRASSLRGVVGKDLWGIGLFGGVGWDRYSGDASIAVTDPEAGSGPFTGSGELRSERHLYFLGASMTFLTLQISAEVGLAEGFDPALPLQTQGGFDPSSRSEFGSVALRLTF